MSCTTSRPMMPYRSCGNPRSNGFRNCARRLPILAASFRRATFANSTMPFTHCTRMPPRSCESSAQREGGNFGARLDRPALAVLAPQVVVRLRQVGDAHVFAVVEDFSSCSQSNDAEQHHLGEPGGVLERAGRFGLAFGRVHPVHFVSFAGNARQLYRRLAKRIVE